MSTTIESLVDELYKFPGKAEIVNGRIVPLASTGDRPSCAALSIVVSLREYGKRTGSGRAYTDGTAFLVDLPNRKSFCPDASFHTGPRTGMKFLDGAPAFAVEVRSENDYGRYAERQMAAKRADYFGAGTLVVWDVDLEGADTVRVYRGNAVEPAAIYRKGQIANAEPAVPGWTFPVDDLFE